METQRHVRVNFSHSRNFVEILVDPSADINTCGDTSRCVFQKNKTSLQKRANNESTYQLQSAYEDEGAPSAAAAHCVGGLDSDSEPAVEGLEEGAEACLGSDTGLSADPRTAVPFSCCGPTLSVFSSLVTEADQTPGSQ